MSEGTTHSYIEVLYRGRSEHSQRRSSAGDQIIMCRMQASVNVQCNLTIVVETVLGVRFWLHVTIDRSLLSFRPGFRVST